MGTLFLAILVTVKALATPIQLLSNRVRGTKEGIRMTGGFLYGMIAAEIALTLVWALATIVAWDLARAAS